MKRVILGIILLVLFCEICSYLTLRIIGINPFQGNVKYTYGRCVSGYTVTGNLPLFKFKGYDGLNNFKLEQQQIDSNGFMADEEIATEKPDSTIRIFITGGSAAFGALQTRAVVQDSSYPEGVYTFNSSIAGILQQNLRKQFPNKKFQVINAAVVMHFFHQGYLSYLTNIHRFHPDLLINIDGFNDMAMTFDNGDVFATGEQELDYYLNKDYIAPHEPWPFTIHLINTLIDKVMKTEGRKIRLVSTYNGNDPRSYTDGVPILKRNSNEMLWCASSLMRQLQTDGVKHIFCLQPIMNRDIQKKFSSLEMKIKSEVDKHNPSNGFKGRFIDEYFSKSIDSAAHLSGSEFIDMNRELAFLGPETEIYVDYCHLTPTGNKLVAAKLQEKVELLLHLAR